jgi:hypothetical protein
VWGVGVVWKARRVVVVGVGCGMVGAEGRFRVPVVRTESRIVLFAGASGVFCCIVATGFGASFLAVRAGAVFFAFTAPPRTALIFCATGSCAAAAIMPASPGTAFFGHPRSLMAGGSIVVVEDIARVQLDDTL